MQKFKECENFKVEPGLSDRDIVTVICMIKTIRCPVRVCNPDNANPKNVNMC